jgi:putative transposase
MMEKRKDFGLFSGGVSKEVATGSEFDFERFKQELVEGIRAGKNLSGRGGLLAPLVKQVLELSLEGELSSHLHKEQSSEGKGFNRRNGHSSKVVKTTAGSFELQTPRDRAGSFEPEIVGKRQTWISGEIEDRIIALYASGMSYRDIAEFIEGTYQVHVSAGAISAITDRILEHAEKWRTRPLEGIYCCAWLDAIHYRIRSEQSGQVEARAVHCILGVDTEGRKEVLGLYLAPGAESSRFWLGVLEDLKQRGVKDILIACTDGLPGFAAAIEHVFPDCDVQACIVHQLRASSKYVPDSKRRELVKDLKGIYHAGNAEQAEEALQKLEIKWEKYPLALRGWRTNFARLTAFLHYPAAIRKLIYTTNTIEAYNRQLRKVTKTKGAFVNDKALMKLLFVATIKASERWAFTQQWHQVRTEFYLVFQERLEPNPKNDTV